MPKLGMPQNNFIKEIRNLVNEKCCNLWPWDVAEIAKHTNQDVINTGEECVVIPGIDSVQEVIAYTFFNLNPLRAKELYYSQKIYSTLFPNNFPRFYSASGASIIYRDLPSGTIRQKIEKQEKGEINYPFQKVIDICNAIGLPLLVEISGENIMVSKDGGEYYLDTTSQLYPDSIDEQRLFEYMKIHFTEKNIRIVKSSIARLKEVYVQADIQRKMKKK